MAEMSVMLVSQNARIAKLRNIALQRIILNFGNIILKCGGLRIAVFETKGYFYDRIYKQPGTGFMAHF